MKVGIDGVLLGAWADLGNACRMLDIGTGTGLLALMAAQRSKALIDAVELEPNTAAEALLNFKNSKWHTRISLSVCAFQEYITAVKYDHILSNPPFFEDSPRPANVRRAQARHADSLNLEELLEKSFPLLSATGKISLVLPAASEERLRFLARKNSLFINRFCRVSPDETKRPHRLMAELSKQAIPVAESGIIIRNAGSAAYTDQYRELTHEFYLAF